HRHRRPGQVAGPALRTAFPRLRRFGLRHLRRLLLPRQDGGGGRRRQHRGGEALFLTKFASKVYLVHRRDELRAERILQDRLFAHPKVEVIWNSRIDEVLGAEDPLGVRGVRLKDVKTGEARELAVDGVFVAIGHAPASELFLGQLETKQGGYLTVKPG